MDTDLFETLFARFVDAVEVATQVLLTAIKRPGLPGLCCFLSLAILG